MDSIQQLEKMWRKSVSYEDYLKEAKFNLIAAVFRKGYATVKNSEVGIKIEVEPIFLTLFLSNIDELKDFFNKKIHITVKSENN